MFCLWLNGRKINNSADIITNYDSEALRGYFLGGILVRWLRMCGDDKMSEKVAGIDINGDIDTALAIAFGLIDKPLVAPQIKAEVNTVAEVTAPVLQSSFNAQLPTALSSFTALTSFSAFLPSSFSAFAPSSFEMTALSSFNISALTSFSVASFSSFTGSFSTTTSFSLSSSFSSVYGSFTAGSFKPAVMQSEPTAEKHKTDACELTPQEKVLINLSSDPLNRFGYGIHLL